MSKSVFARQRQADMPEVTHEIQMGKKEKEGNHISVTLLVIFSVLT
jgi:hypothetical protein